MSSQLQNFLSGQRVFTDDEIAVLRSLSRLEERTNSLTVLHGTDGNDELRGSDEDEILFGFAGDDILRGGNGADRIFAGQGNDYLYGGDGDDMLVGGHGNDIYVIDSSNDVVQESVNGGEDVVWSHVAYTLGNNLENLSLQGSENIYGTGNAMNNVLRGNGGNNILTGEDGDDYLYGGEGMDTLVGGNGNDIYVIEHEGETVSENSDGGSDTVWSTISYTLGENLENLSLRGSGQIDGVGNGLNNTIRGNESNNRLQGGDGDDYLYGGLGDDILDGGNGNDIYVIEDGGDSIIESSSGGTDAVWSTVSYALGENLENLTLRGEEAINGRGNEQNNRLYGNAANNQLQGGQGNDVLLGGMGADSLMGGSGADSFRFTSVSELGDSVVDFNASERDTIYFSANFGRLPAGVLEPRRFESNNTGLASTGQTRFIFNELSGGIFYDVDGRGASPSLLVAHLNVRTLSNQDIVIAA